VNAKFNKQNSAREFNFDKCNILKLMFGKWIFLVVGLGLGVSSGPKFESFFRTSFLSDQTYRVFYLPKFDARLDLFEQNGRASTLVGLVIPFQYRTGFKADL